MEGTVKKRGGKRYFSDLDFPVLVDWYSGSASAAPRVTYHEEIELQFYLGGTGAYFIGDQNYTVERNSVLIVHKNEVHCYIPRSGSFLERVNLVFGADILKERAVALGAIRNLSSYHHLTLSEREAVAAEYGLREIQGEYGRRALHWETAVCNGIEKLLIILDRVKDRKAPNAGIAAPFVRRVIAYVDEHLAEKLTLARVASHLHMSPGFLSRRFKQCVGMGFREHLIHRRIMEARKLLAGTDQKIAAVARDVGFDDVSTFNRDFKLLTDVTPSAYRMSLVGQKEKE